MASRFYITNHAPAFQPPLLGAWDTETAVVYRELGLRDGPLGTVSQAETSSNITWDMALLCLVLKLPFGGTIVPGTDTLDVRYGRLSSVASSFRAHSHIWISVGATNAVRRTMAIDSIGAATWLTSPIYTFSAIDPSSDTVVTAGDHLVWELGARAITSSTSSRTASIYYGGLGPDPDTDDAVTNQAGWLDLYNELEDFLPRLPISGTPLMTA